MEYADLRDKVKAHKRSVASMNRHKPDRRFVYLVFRCCFIILGLSFVVRLLIFRFTIACCKFISVNSRDYMATSHRSLDIQDPNRLVHWQLCPRRKLRLPHLSFVGVWFEPVMDLPYRQAGLFITLGTEVTQSIWLS